MPALTAVTGESLASVAPESLDDTASSVDTSPRQRSKRKQYGFGKRFAYQKLRGWRPTYSALVAEAFFFACGTLLVALGIPILVASLNIQQYSVRYDNVGPMAGLSKAEKQQALWASGDGGLIYSVDISVEERMEPPIWVVYELGEVHQNYRRYVRSYDSNQMKDGSSVPGVDACLPFKYETFDINSTLPRDGAILPCGQIAHSNFNDSYSLSIGGQAINIDDSNIAWSADRRYLYGAVDAINYNEIPDYRGGNGSDVPLNQNQHWMVWMRPAAKVPAQKLYGRIDEAIEGGSIVTLTVNNRYNTYGFEGEKRITLTTNSWVGGRNLFLPILYLVIGGLCDTIALAFFGGYNLGMVRKRSPGAEDDFSWVRGEVEQRDRRSGARVVAQPAQPATTSRSEADET